MMITDVGAAYSLDSDETVIVPEIKLDLSGPELEYIQNLYKPTIIMVWIPSYPSMVRNLILCHECNSFHLSI